MDRTGAGLMGATSLFPVFQVGFPERLVEEAHHHPRQTLVRAFCENDNNTLGNLLGVTRIV
jgi:hypothetical protein